MMNFNNFNAGGDISGIANPFSDAYNILLQNTHKLI